MGKTLTVVISLLAPLAVWLAVEALSPSYQLNEQGIAKRRAVFLWSTIAMSTGISVIAAMFPH